MTISDVSQKCKLIKNRFKPLKKLYMNVVSIMLKFFICAFFTSHIKEFTMEDDF